MSAVMEGMVDLAYQLGRMTAQMEAIHTCELAHLRYPWPPDPECDACRKRIEQFVDKHHLEMPYRLFGFDWLVSHYKQYLDRRTEKARAWREMGSGI